MTKSARLLEESGGPAVEVCEGMIGLLPIIPLVTLFSQPSAEVVSSPRVAQVRLAETLAEADAIESVAAKGHAITFVIVREGETFDVTAKTKKSGEIVSLAIARAPQALAVQLHGLTWLGSELADVAAVTRLNVDEDGGVMIGTDDGRRYMAIPGRGSGGANVAAESRWAAAWSDDDS
jgi:hypothetical protein